MDSDKVESIAQHLLSLKDVIAAGLRSPALLLQMFQKLPLDHRSACLKISARLYEVLQRSGQPKPVAQRSSSGIFSSPMQKGGSALSPTSSVRVSPVPSPILSPRHGTHSSPVAAAEPAQVFSLPHQLFRQAVLGSCDSPQEIGYETIPRAGSAGLMSNDLRPIRIFLQTYPEVLEVLHSMMADGEAGEALQALSFANMMWVQTHPMDFGANAIDMNRISIGLRLAQNGGEKSGLKGNIKSSNVGQSLEESMKHLLFLNLRLKYPASMWVDILQLRDERLHMLKAAQQELASAVASAGVAQLQFPSLVKTMNALDSVISGTSLLSSNSKPEDIQEILFSRYSAAVVDVGYLLHDHEDLRKVKKLCASFERCCGQVVTSLKDALRSIAEQQQQQQDVAAAVAVPSVSEGAQKVSVADSDQCEIHFDDI